MKFAAKIAGLYLLTLVVVILVVVGYALARFTIANPFALLPESIVLAIILCSLGEYQ